MPTLTPKPAGQTSGARLPLRPFALLLTVLLTMGTVALGTGNASAAEPDGPVFGPATTASMYVGEAASITDFIPTGGTNTVYR